MKKFRFELEGKVYTEFEVEAENYEEALEIAEGPEGSDACLEEINFSGTMQEHEVIRGYEVKD